MFRQVNLTSVAKAGILGTLIMTILMYGLPPLMGNPPMDIMAALGSVFPFKISPYIFGFLAHFGFGIGLTFIYATFFFGWLPGPYWLRGAIFSLLPWLFAITLLGPSLQLASQIFGSASSATANPCAPKAKNPCAAANPCAATTSVNPCASNASAANPCASQKANPCAAAAVNPCVAGAAPKGGIPPQFLSLMVHFIYGGVLGAFYRPRA